jgi:multidrug efflux pump
VRLHVDRATAARLGVDMSALDNTLYDAFGQRQVSTIYQDMNQYHVVMEVEPRFWQSPDTLKDIYVSTSGGALRGTAASGAAPGTFLSSAATAGTAGATTTTTATSTSTNTAAASAAAQNYELNQLTNSAGRASTGSALSTAPDTMVPLAAFSHYGPGLTPLAVNHHGPFVAATIAFNVPQGEALGTALGSIGRTLEDIHVPLSIHGESAGSLKIFEETVIEEPLLILASLVAVYIVLGILYESLTQPITILSTLPSSGIGAVLALILFGESFTLIALIAVILLIGIVLKNAIMMVDVALATQRAHHEGAAEAIHAACMLRFRPIMMTTLAAMMGALPLALFTGQGSEMRRPLGIAIVGGLLISQILTLYTTPVMYIYLDRFRLWFGRTFSRGGRRPGATPAGSHA